ncbi:MAG: T9SS type A sorting domain-containing protein [Chitinophagaceae bacterium]|nr:T9SS type A sorting domain-containing protein [Chitinophagaceae bacterium]
MKAGLALLLLVLTFTSQLAAQKKCSDQNYQQQRLKDDPALAQLMSHTESYIQRQITEGIAARGEATIIKIPVVIHNLYHYPTEKISLEQVQSQLNALNNCFRRRSADTARTPVYFKNLAADCQIEFYLAISDSRKRSTTGLIRKYTPIKEWEADDKMKFNAEMGDDAWDPNSYLNIWVCNLSRVAGYSSIPGDAAGKDGVVIDLEAFGTLNTQAGYEMGKTTVHEVGHWLGLKHIWGDDYCGDDGVSDTPKQAGYNIDCPNTINVTCGNGPYGDMYMNYMDLTSDACMNLFTEGQKARMRSFFAAGGARVKILSSTGLNLPLIAESPLPEEDPKWLQPQLYPNPANNFINLDLAYDSRWMGKAINVINLQGQIVMSVQVTAKNLRIDLQKLQAGIYFLAAKKDDGESLKMKFVKL